MYVMKNVRIEDLDFISAGILAKNAWRSLTVYRESKSEALGIKRCLEKEAIKCEIHMGGRMDFLPRTTLIISCFTNQDFREALCRISLYPPHEDLTYIVGIPHEIAPVPGYCRPNQLYTWKTKIKISGRMVRLYRTSLVP